MSGHHRPAHRATLTALVVGIALAALVPGGAAAGGQPAPPGSGAPDSGARGLPNASAHPPLREILRDPLWYLSSPGASAGELLRRTSGLLTDDRAALPTIAVSIELAAPATQPVLDELVAEGARVVNVAGPTVEAYAATGRLRALAAVDAVRAIRPIRRQAATGTVSPAVALHGSDVWQAAGLTGAGVKVGIIDGGFDGIAARLGKDAPAAVHAHCYTSVGKFTTNVADCANGESHGTAVAEAVFDMAPGIDLYVADPISRLDEKNVVTWMTGNGVRIINASFLSGLVFDGPGDGTSPYGDSLYSLVDRAVAGGALWVNAAGNAGDSGWTGAWTDPDSDGLLDFAPGVSADRMTLAAGTDVTVAIRWADPWGASSNNYDLELYEGSALVASSTDVQAGAGDPFEVIEYQAPTAGTYAIKIRRVAGAPTNRMQLLVGTSDDVHLAHQVVDGTLPTPADSANPGMLAVGAVRLDRPTEIEAYSSRGPTLDGRIKPDLVAVDCAPTPTVTQFCGTSESTPFVTGAAAQVLEARPTLAPAQLANWLRSHAVPLGSPIPNSTFGAGRLNLGALPFEPPAGLAFASPPTGGLAGTPLTGQPAVTLVDASGLVVSVGPGSVTSVTISLASNPAGATLSCAGGATRAATAGLAVFAGCSIDRPGTGYVIQAAAAGLPPAVSAPFEILAPGSALPLALAASPGTITLGGSAMLSARFAPAPLTAARPLQVERSSDGVHWSSAGTAATDAGGGLVMRVAPTVSGWYRVRFAGGADLPAAGTYPVRVIVRQAIVLSASIRSPRTIGHGTTVTFTATVRPGGAGLPRATVGFVVYRRVGTGWVAYRRISVPTDASGRARLVWRFGTAGFWNVKASAAATSANGSSGWSASARYEVR